MRIEEEENWIYEGTREELKSILYCGWQDRDKIERRKEEEFHNSKFQPHTQHKLNMNFVAQVEDHLRDLGAEARKNHPGKV